jgi:capsid portal protein
MRSRSELESSAVGDSNETELNLDSLAQYLRAEYKDRVHSSSSAISELVKELKITGYARIGYIFVDLKKTRKVFLEYEKKHHPHSVDERYADVGVVRVSLSIANPAYLAARLQQPSQSQLADYDKVRPLIGRDEEHGAN